jgi:hypothetical protein
MPVAITSYTAAHTSGERRRRGDQDPRPAPRAGGRGKLLVGRAGDRCSLGAHRPSLSLELGFDSNAWTTVEAKARQRGGVGPFPFFYLGWDSFRFLSGRGGNKTLPRI